MKRSAGKSRPSLAGVGAGAELGNTQSTKMLKKNSIYVDIPDDLEIVPRSMII